MPTRLSSRERMLAALDCREVDYVPCCFGSFNILLHQCADQAEFLDRQLDMGLDVIARISVPEPHFDARVEIREWREELPGERYPLLHKAYDTPAGTLETRVEQREDWPHGDHIPLIEAGVDVLMGVDPAQDRTMDLHALKRQAGAKMCVWGGVCGYLTVECGTEEDIAAEVRQAISVLAPGGGLILAPVTNVRADTPRAWDNVRAMIGEWRSLRQYGGS